MSEELIIGITFCLCYMILAVVFVICLFKE